MKILVINHEYPPLGGGGGIFCRNLCEAWAKRGHQVFVVTSRAPSLKKEERIAGVDLYRCWAGGKRLKQKAGFLNLLFFTLSGFFSSWRFLRKHKPDFLNVHFAIPAGLIGYWLQFFFGSKNILTLHGADIYDPSRKMSGHRWKLTRWSISLIINKATQTIASTQEIKKQAEKYYRFRKKIKIIPLGLPENDFLEKASKDYNSSEEPLHLITIGRLIARKNVGLLVEAIAGLKKDILLTIVGDGPQKEKIKKLAEKMKVADRIQFLGQVSERVKYQQLLQADLFVSSALHEGFGLVFLEAMQAGLGIIATNCGGQVYFLKEGENAKFFKSGSKADLITKINYFYKNRSVLEQYGRANKELVKRYYIDRVAGEYLGVLNN
jgi:L-malate glycosyltransferase